MPVSRRNFLQYGGVAGVAAMLPAARAVTGPSPRPPQGRWRGMTTTSQITQQDVVDFAATGGNVLRPAFAGNHLVDKSAPYALDQAAFDQLDRILDWCEQAGVAVVIDPHTFPGFSDNFTTFPTDEFWSDYRFHDIIESFWDYTAARYRDRGPVIAGYDLLNEPAVPDVRADSGPASWNELILRLVRTIRARDTEHHIIVEPAISAKPEGPLWYSYFEAINELPPPPDRRIVVSPHMYVPHAFTQQGIPGNGYPSGIQYPGQIQGQGWEGLPDTVYWDRQAMDDYMRPALDYSRRYKVPVYVGEFSAVRWSGASGNRYLADCIAFFETYGWSWSYHSWREYQGWDAEMDSDPNDLTRYASTPRLELLERYFRRNRTA